MSDQDEKNERTIIITQKVDLKDLRTTALEPYLIQISGRETGQMHKLTGHKVIKIGRDPLSQIVLDDPHISRHHAEILVRAERDIVIRDLGSTNGVFVNGNKVKEQALVDGDKLLLGTRLHFKFAYQDSVEQNYQQNLFRAANIDALTQLYNKKYFIDALTKEFSYARRNNQPLSLLMCDVDFFKKINDTHGHLAGDLVLKTIGTYFTKNLRLENVACRYGGEEFAVILRNVDSALAVRIGDRVRNDLAKEKIQFKEALIPITLSVGIATLESANYETIEDFIQSADQHLYEAKETGRNKTIFKKVA